MSPIRITKILPVLALIFVSPARSDDETAEPTPSEDQIRAIVRDEIKDLREDIATIKETLAELRNSGTVNTVDPPAPVVEPAQDGFTPLSEAEAVEKAAKQPKEAEDPNKHEGVGPEAKDGPGPLPPNLPNVVPEAVQSLGLREKILAHYALEIAGAKSFSANPRKAAEALKKILEDFLGRLALLGDKIEPSQHDQLLQQLRGEVLDFFEDNEASAKDWQEFLRGIDTEALDPSLKSNWVMVLTELVSGFDDVAKEILKEEFKNPLEANQGITAARASAGAVGAASGATSGGRSVRRTVWRSRTGWGVEYERSGPFHRVIRKRSYQSP